MVNKAKLDDLRERLEMADRHWLQVARNKKQRVSEFNEEIEEINEKRIKILQEIEDINKPAPPLLASIDDDKEEE